MLNFKVFSLCLFLWSNTVFVRAEVYAVRDTLSYWQNVVKLHPELTEPRVILSWKYFALAKNSGEVALLKQSCEQLTQALSIRPDKNAIKLAINFSSYQHNFSLLDSLAQYYLSYWPYDSQVHLWYLQAAIAQNRDKLIDTIKNILLSLPADLYTLLGKADLAGYQENFSARRQFLRQALEVASEQKTQAWLWLQLAVIHLDNQRNLKLADQALIKAEQLDPNSAAIQRHRIEWLIFNGNKSLAKKKLTKLKQWHQHHELVKFDVMINTLYKDKYPNKLDSKHQTTLGHICQSTFNKLVAKR
ncbi:MAG: hypothetical protein HRT53_07420 [Colwellia sp.]|nr:hypothetical protein [Colwellia sp.]